MQEPSVLGRAVLLVRDLRERCLWDRAQTAQSLRPYLVEEALELDQALGDGDPARIRDELGDLLLHLAFQIVLGEESGRFGAADVVSALEEKMWRRHPHLFPQAEATTGGHGAPGTLATAAPGDPVSAASGTAGASEPAHAADGDAPRTEGHGSWERTKLVERAAQPGVLDGLPPGLPELIMAFRLQERAAGVGFDWPDATGPAAKVREELAELEAELAQPAGADPARIQHEIGDLLFAVVNWARKLGCDPRSALEQANRRFQDRFRQLERLAAERGVPVGSAPLEELDRLWEEVK